jgi:hypothetical protein
MANSHGLAEAQLLDDVRDIVCVSRDRVGAGRLVTLAVPAEIYRYDPMPPGEVLGLRGEKRAVACPPMDEDKGGLASAAVLEGQLCAVVYNRRHIFSSILSRATLPQVRVRP